MAVKIKGMKLPESCEDCPFTYKNIIGEKVCNARFDYRLPTLVVTDLFLVRHDECPLEEVDD